MEFELRKYASAVAKHISENESLVPLEQAYKCGFQKALDLIEQARKDRGPDFDIDALAFMIERLKTKGEY